MLRLQNPADLESWRLRLEKSGFFQSIRPLSAHWLVGERPLQDSPPPSGPGKRILAEDTCPTLVSQNVSPPKGESDWLASARTLQGDGTFGWIQDDESAAFWRSPCARPCLFFGKIPGVNAWGTLLHYFHQILEMRELDPLPLALFASGTAMYPWNRSPLQGVHAIPRGGAHYVDSSGNAAPIREWWDPRPAATKPATEEEMKDHADYYRTTILDHLNQELDPSAPNFITMSGGADSGTLACLAGGILKKNLISWSFVSTHPRVREKNAHYLNAAWKLARPIHKIEVPIESSFWIHLLKQKTRSFLPVAHPALLDAPKWRSIFPFKTFLGGEFADEVCGTRMHWPDWLLEVRWPWLVRHSNRLPYGPSSILPLVKARSLAFVGMAAPCLPIPQLPQVFAPSLHQEREEWVQSLATQALKDRKPWKHFWNRSQGAAWMDLNWDRLSPLGVRRVAPFFNRNLLERMLQLHPSDLIGPGQKRLLHAAFRGLVPSEVLFRQDFGAEPKNLGAQLKDLEIQEPLPHQKLLNPMPNGDSQLTLRDFFAYLSPINSLNS